MRIRPIHFVPDIAAAVRFYRALGLDPEARAIRAVGRAGRRRRRPGPPRRRDRRGRRSREGVALGFVADEPLEAVERRLREAGFPPEGTIVDQEWGRSLLVRGPDGAVVQIDEQDRELYT